MDPLTIVFVVATLIFSVVIHEVSHGYAADALGDPTARMAGRLTLNPIPHIDLWGSIIVPGLLALLPGGIIFGWAKPVPYNPYNISNKYGDALVAAAGPASNIILAVLLGILLRINESAAFFSTTVSDALLFIIFINIILAIFNLVPIPPLDGSKILFNFLPYNFEYIREALERWGLFILLFFIFFLWRFIFPIVVFVTTAIADVSVSELSRALMSFF